MSLWEIIVSILRGLLMSRENMMAENLALRQQIGMFTRTMKKPKPTQADRLFWIILCRLWPHWQEALNNFTPETVVRWHKAGFRQFWRWKSSHRRPGRPRISPEIRALIKIMANDNPIWGAPRIHDELAKLGFEVDERTISRYLKRLHRTPQKPSFRSWITFLRNHMSTMASIDMFSVHTVFFRVLTVFIVLSHDRRRVLHFHVTDHPHPEWLIRQVLQAFPWDTAPDYLLRDGDKNFDPHFRERVGNMGIKQVVICPESPWKNPFVERLIGSIRKECLDHMLVFNEAHFSRILKAYFDYYHADRTHQGIESDTPLGRPVEPRPSPDAKVVGQPRLGGLHHRNGWQRAA